MAKFSYGDAHVQRCLEKSGKRRASGRMNEAGGGAVAATSRRARVQPAIVEAQRLHVSRAPTVI